MLAWIIIGLVLAGIELAIGELTLLMLGIAAIGTGLIAGATGMPLIAEGLVFAGLSLIMLVVAKPMIKKRMITPPVLDTSVKALEGQSAQVVEEVTEFDGQVRLDGSLWSARALIGGDTIPAGTLVSVVSIDGTTAVVVRKD